jgi:hypothetical protein
MESAGDHRYVEMRSDCSDQLTSAQPLSRRERNSEQLGRFAGDCLRHLFVAGVDSRPDEANLVSVLPQVRPNKSWADRRHSPGSLGIDLEENDSHTPADAVYAEYRVPSAVSRQPAAVSSQSLVVSQSTRALCHGDESFFLHESFLVGGTRGFAGTSEVVSRE